LCWGWDEKSAKVKSVQVVCMGGKEIEIVDRNTTQVKFQVVLRTGSQVHPLLQDLKLLNQYNKRKYRKCKQGTCIKDHSAMQVLRMSCGPYL
jgi:hypothetical protein